MKRVWIFVCCCVAPLLCAGPAQAVTRYVDVNSTIPRAPYTNATEAAVTIQEAVDTAVAGDLILVAPGTYAEGGSIVYGSLSNRVALTNAVMLRSTGSPANTIIQGLAGVNRPT